MKIIAFITAFVALSATAQKEISGFVKSKLTNQPIANARLQLEETGETSITDETGAFMFFGNYPGAIHLHVSAFEFESKLLFLAESANALGRHYLMPSSLEIFLAERHLDLEDITVSTGTNVQKNKSPFLVESRKLSDLNGIATLNMGEALAKIPGVYQSSLGNGISKPVIRGLQGIRVVGLLNGMRMEGQQWGGDHGMGISEVGIGSVEVIKGPASLLYGADALGGVLYYSDESYAAVHSQSLKVQSVYHSNTNGGALRVLYKQSNQKFRFLLGGSYANHADFQLPNKKFAQNSRFNESVIKSALSWNGKNKVHHLRYSFNHVMSGLPGHTHDSILNPLEFQSEIQRRKQTIPAQFFDNHYLSFENKWFAERNEFSILLGQTLNQLTEYDEKVTIPGIQMRLWNSLYTAKWTHTFPNNVKVVNGVQGMFQVNVNGAEGTEKLLPNAHSLDNGIFSIWMYEKDRWNFQGGLRYDVRNLKTLEDFKGSPAIVKTFASPNASIGAVYADEKMTFRTNFSTGYRAPHSSELLANGFHHGALRYEIGDANLRPEKASQLDLSMELKGDHVVFVFNPFINKINHFMYLQPSDSSVGNLPVFLYKQLEQVWFYGSDVGFHYHPHFAHDLHLEGTFSYLNVSTQSDSSISMIPPSRFTLSLRYQFDLGKKFQVKEVLVQHTYMNGQGKVAFYESSSPSYQLLDASLSFKWNGKTAIDFQVGCKNIFNTSYIDHLSRLKNISMPSPGRNIYISINFNISNQLKNQKS
ncbi:MAG: TonB-dependent receptor [Crocinitomicaceae bacterium]|nr:TonB-dependent receptor [Crocinitomicaceae bacterium]MDP4761693.1 TonB-dependent receptor [Crocinitomicaceae bacterium]